VAELPACHQRNSREEANSPAPGSRVDLEEQALERQGDWCYTEMGWGRGGDGKQGKGTAQHTALTWPGVTSLQAEPGNPRGRWHLQR